MDYNVESCRYMTKGMPQGSPTSPFLSILAESAAFNSFVHPGVQRIAYADDGIVYADRDFSLYRNEAQMVLGLEYAPEKCG